MQTVARCTSLLLILTASQAFAHTEHNSFLDQSAFSSNDLIRQLRSDPEVLMRYERHFKMTEPDLEHYFSGLHVEPLTESRRYLVFNVDDSYKIGYRLLHLEKGTLVFADATHKPILKRSCGNPMTAYLPAIGEKTTALHGAGPQEDDMRSSDALALAGGGAAIAGADDAGTLAGVAPGEPSSDLLASTSPVSGSPLTIVQQTPPGGDTPPSGPGLGVGALGIIALIGGAGGALIGGSGGHGISPNVAPEPTSLLAIGMGAALFALRRRKKG